MHSKDQIVEEIESVVSRHGARRYRMWFIGVETSFECMRHRSWFKHSYCWEADSQATALQVEKIFLEKGMHLDYAQDARGRYVYIF